MKPHKILKFAKLRGLDGIVVCDHNTIKGGLETKKLNTDANFIVIVGAEIATDAGDITGIFLTKEIESRTFNEVVYEIRQQGGKVILNHPFKGHDLSKIDYSKIDYIEGYNSRLDEKNNIKAVELAQKHNIPVIAGSDAHLYAEIANCKTFIDSLDSLNPVNCEYKPSRQTYVTVSQYIKAAKKRSIKVFVSTTAIYIKYLLKKVSILK
jgi:predicted metal-dependent phosphoesterase TrpH